MKVILKKGDIQINIEHASEIEIANLIGLISKFDNVKEQKNEITGSSNTKLSGRTISDKYPTVEEFVDSMRNNSNMALYHKLDKVLETMGKPIPKDITERQRVYARFSRAKKVVLGVK